MKRQKSRLGAVVRSRYSDQLGIVKAERPYEHFKGKYMVEIVMADGREHVVRHDYLIFVRDPAIKVTERCEVLIRSDLAGGRHSYGVAQHQAYIFDAKIVSGPYVLYSVHRSWREAYNVALVADAESIGRRMKFYGALEVGHNFCDFMVSCDRFIKDSR